MFTDRILSVIDQSFFCIPEEYGRKGRAWV